MRFLLAFAVLLSLAACGLGTPAVIDGSSPEAFEQSLDEVRAQLSPGDRARFEAAVNMVRASAFAKSDNRSEMSDRVRRKLDGKTAEQVIAEAEERQRNIANAAVDQVFKIKKQVTQEINEIKGAKGEP